MRTLRYLIVLFLAFIISCGDSPEKDVAKDESSSMIEGFWKRTGMVQYVNGVAVDTLFYSDGDLDPPGKDFIQMKAFLDGNIFWMMNNHNLSSPWKGSMGGYGKYKKEKDTITEFMSHGTGDMAQYLTYLMDSTKTSSFPFKFGYDLTNENYIQIDNPNEEGVTMAEFYEKMPNLRKSKMDGVWKRAYEITYVNGIAVDTTSVPSDVVLDVKIIKDGYFLFQVDRTKIFDVSKRGFGGTGGFGEVEYSNGEMREYTQFASGGWLLDTIPRSIVNYASVEFYDDDTFIQINKDTLNQLQAGRGVVYRRIK